MKLGMLQEIDWEHVGAMLAREHDQEQVAFFKAFLTECSSWGTHYQVERQLAAINRKLSKEERESLAMLSYEETCETEDC